MNAKRAHDTRAHVRMEPKTNVTDTRSARQGLLVRGGRELRYGEGELGAVCPEPLERPGGVGLNVEAEAPARGGDAEQNGGAVGALGATGEQAVQPELRDGLNSRSEALLSSGSRGSSRKRISASQWFR